MISRRKSCWVSLLGDSPFAFAIFKGSHDVHEPTVAERAGLVQRRAPAVVLAVQPGAVLQKELRRRYVAADGGHVEGGAAGDSIRRVRSAADASTRKQDSYAGQRQRANQVLVLGSKQGACNYLHVSGFTLEGGPDYHQGFKIQESVRGYASHLVPSERAKLTAPLVALAAHLPDVVGRVRFCPAVEEQLQEVQVAGQHGVAQHAPRLAQLQLGALGQEDLHGDAVAAADCLQQRSGAGVIWPNQWEGIKSALLV